MWGNNQYPGLLDDPNQMPGAPWDPRMGPPPPPPPAGVSTMPTGAPPQQGMSMGMRSAISNVGQQLAAGGPLNFGSMAAPILQQMQMQRQAAGKPGLLKSFLGGGK